MQRSNKNLRASNNSEPVIDPALERPLLSLHRAMDVSSFWRAVKQLLSAAMPNRVIGLTLQHTPILPLIARWTQPMPQGFFAAEPLQSYVVRRPRQKFVQIRDLFSNRRTFTKSAFYRRYMARQKCVHGICLFFWKGQRLVCMIAIMRTAAEGALSPAETKLLRQLYPQFLAVLRRLESLERQRSVLIGLEEFVGRLPLPTIILRWDLRLIYQNRAARDFSAVWEKGPEEARMTKARSPIPSEILDRCRVLKQQWTRTRRTNAPQAGCQEEQVHHPRRPHLRATIHLKQLKLAGVARPHFLIQCEDLRRHTASGEAPENSRLPHLVQLTNREQEVAGLVCDGRSNQEIAENARLSVPMVKKHLHAVYRKLEVPSRSRLMTLMR
ncbi:MAG: LuxR C-terminal-related transcriptional regulator [Candidatus Udaeobacter sp.]